MKKATLIHPRKLTRVMQEFLAQVMEVEELTRTVEEWHPEDLFKRLNGEKVETKFVDVFVAPKLHCRNDYNNFSVNVDDFLEDLDALTIDFYYGPNIFLHKSGRNYKRGELGFAMADEGKRASYMKGFSQAVRILLHELGHVMTEEQIRKKYGKETIIEMRKNCRGNENYIRLPDEYAATQWAIDWLADPDHRKIARDFEKKFWACFA